MYAPDLLNPPGPPTDPPPVGYGPLVGIQVAPNGEVVAVFAGGIQMPVTPGVPAPGPPTQPQNNIEWLDTDGAILAAHGAFAEPPFGLVGSFWEVYSRAQPGGARLAGLQIVGDVSPAIAAYAQDPVTGAHNVQLIDKDGDSSFARLPTPIDLEIVGGFVSGAGAISAGRDTGGFSITRTGVGRYTFTGDDPVRTYTPFSLVPGINAQVFMFVQAFLTAQSFSYGFNSSAGVAIDAGHSISAFSLG